MHKFEIRENVFSEKLGEYYVAHIHPSTGEIIGYLYADGTIHHTCLEAGEKSGYYVNLEEAENAISTHIRLVSGWQITRRSGEFGKFYIYRPAFNCMESGYLHKDGVVRIGCTKTVYHEYRGKIEPSGWYQSFSEVLETIERWYTVPQRHSVTVMGTEESVTPESSPVGTYFKDGSSVFIKDTQSYLVNIVTGHRYELAQIDKGNLKIIPKGQKIVIEVAY